jgi:hypothetical protein
MYYNFTIFIFHFVLESSCCHHYFEFIRVPSFLYVFFLFFIQIGIVSFALYNFTVSILIKLMIYIFGNFNCSEFSLAVNQYFLVKLLAYYFPNILIVSYAWIVWIIFCENNLEANLIWR